MGPAQAGDIPQPTPEELGKYFEERKVVFRAPEYRKVTLLSMTPADLAKPDAVSRRRRQELLRPAQSELRHARTPRTAPDRVSEAEDAAAARERIAKGASFDDIAKERGLKASDTDLGMVAKADIIDPAVADAAFALKPGEVSAPVKGQFRHRAAASRQDRAGHAKDL